jgi:hypothetical protein
LAKKDEEIYRLRVAFSNHAAAIEGAADLAAAVDAAADLAAAVDTASTEQEPKEVSLKEKEEAHNEIYKSLIKKGAGEGIVEQSWETKRGELLCSDGDIDTPSPSSLSSSAPPPTFLG